MVKKGQVMTYERLYFWKDRESCEKFYTQRRHLRKEDIQHKVDLAMMFGSVVCFESEEEMSGFGASGSVK
jgi:hypothetical protein